MSEARCDNCHYSTNSIIQGNASLQCRRYPPTVVIANTPQGVQPINIRPGMNPGDYCGEYKFGIKTTSQFPPLNGKVHLS